MRAAQIDGHAQSSLGLRDAFERVDYLSAATCEFPPELRDQRIGLLPLLPLDLLPYKTIQSPRQNAYRAGKNGYREDREFST